MKKLSKIIVKWTAFRSKGQLPILWVTALFPKKCVMKFIHQTGDVIKQKLLQYRLAFLTSNFENRRKGLQNNICMCSKHCQAGLI